MEERPELPEEQITDPREAGPRPPFPSTAQSFPSQVEGMEPKPDHGETSYRGCEKLKGMKALVTGADSGIGRAVALAFAREGADVAIAYFNEREDASETLRLIEEAGQQGFTAPADIRDEMQCRMLVERTVETFGRIDILVNNAAYQMYYPSLQDVNTTGWERTFRTNVYGLFFLSKAAVPYMQPGSVIINTASTDAYRPNPDRLPYAATQGAIVTFSKGLAQMLIEKGIRVNVVAPGPVWTPMVTYSRPANEVSQLGSNTPIGRPAQPAEIAPVYVLLASPESSYITGAMYEVSGGRLVY